MVTPAPHSVAAVPGFSQVITPPTSDQPWLVSSAVRVATENGYGPRPPFSLWTAGIHWSRRLVRDRARGRVAVAAVDRLDHAFLVDELLERLPDVQLADAGPSFGLLKLIRKYWMP